MNWATPTESHLPNSPASDWRDAHREAIVPSNARIEANGLPLRAFRLF
jgi:post-segregation antitoxin (ccd killing protein)